MSSWMNVSAFLVHFRQETSCGKVGWINYDLISFFCLKIFSSCSPDVFMRVGKKWKIIYEFSYRKILKNCVFSWLKYRLNYFIFRLLQRHLHSSSRLENKSNSISSNRIQRAARFDFCFCALFCVANNVEIIRNTK